MSTGEAASANQEEVDKFPDAIQKVIEEKENMPAQVFDADESVLFWGEKKNSTNSIYYWEKWAPGLKAGRDRWITLFCTNAVGLQSGLPLSIKLLTPDPWRAKINTNCQFFSCPSRGLDENPFSGKERELISSNKKTFESTNLTGKINT